MLTEEEKKRLEEVLARCACPPICLDVAPVRKEDSFKDYTEIWNALPPWKQEELWRNINVQSD